MIHLVTFSDESMSRARKMCASSAKANGVDRTYVFDPVRLKFMGYDDLDLSGRGLGYWKWKPAAIALVLRSINDGDILTYSDAGVEFIAPVSHIINRMDQDIFLFGNNWEHAHWCKRDAMDAIWPAHSQESPQFIFQRFGKQVQASVIFFRVSDYTRAFVKEWLDWCLFEGGRLIDDSPSRLPNHPEFQEHRHDQAILTTMAYREGIKLHWWPGVYLPDDRVYEKWPCYASDTYPPLFRHHRRRDHEWP